jgi:hypothetical protein
MIETKIINEFPTIIHHRVKGPVMEKEAYAGAVEALSVAQQVCGRNKKLYLILDMRSCVFENLKSHKIWSAEFLRHRFLSENAASVAVVGDAGPQLSAEKEMFETDLLRFFSDFNDALKWLKNQN